MDTNNTSGQIQNNEPKKAGVGSIIATVVIIIIIVIGGLYFWGARMKLEQQDQATIQSAGTTTNMAAAVEATHVSATSTGL